MLVAGFVVLALLVTILVYRRKRGQDTAEVDYRAFFVLGICLLPTGLVLSALLNVGMIGVAGLGAFYVVFGLQNRDKWKGRSQ